MHPCSFSRTTIKRTLDSICFSFLELEPIGNGPTVAPKRDLRNPGVAQQRHGNEKSDEVELRSFTGTFKSVQGQ